MRITRMVGAIGLCLCGSGCHMVADITHNMVFETCLFADETKGKVYYPVLAHSAWNAYLAQHPDKADCRDFACGFKLGYADYLEYGGCGGARPLPPMRYWKIRKETPEGRMATEQWSAGFREGAAAAMASGKRELIVVPVSASPSLPPLTNDPPPVGGNLPVAAPTGPTLPTSPPSEELPKPKSLPPATSRPPTVPAPSVRPVSLTSAQRTLVRPPSQELPKPQALPPAAYGQPTVPPPSVKPGVLASTERTLARPASQVLPKPQTIWPAAYSQPTAPLPSLQPLAAPKREQRRVERPRPSTPIQPSVSPNEAGDAAVARIFAEQIIQEGGATVSERLNWAYREAVGRNVKPGEVKVLGELHAKHRAEFTRDPQAARKLVSTGKWAAPANIDVVELAAWTSVARVILNLHEVLTRN